MMIDLKKCIDDFTKNFNQTVTYGKVTITSHRYRSWEYCREAFLKYQNGLPVNGKAKVVDDLALQLAFYLASWGMYRGSSFLLRFDYKIHEPIVEWLLDRQYKELFDQNLYQTNPDRYMELLFGSDKVVGIITKLEGYFKECRMVITGIEKDEVSATLITKILMGVYGCIPAYDRYFVDGLKAYDIQQKFSRNGVSSLLKKIKSVNQEINQVVQKLNGKYAKVYTPMKVVDMYFWEKGKIINEYPFNVIKGIFGEQKKISGNQKTLTKMVDEAFEKLKEMPDEKDMQDFEEFELVLSKSIPMAVDFYKYGKSVAEIAERMGVSETVVRNGLAKVMQKLRHPQISKPIHQNIVVEEQYD